MLITFFMTVVSILRDQLTIHSEQRRPAGLTARSFGSNLRSDRQPAGRTRTARN